MEQVINNGAFANDPAGESIRESFNKAKANFAELYDRWCALTGDQVGGDVATAQPWFPGGGPTTFTLEAATAYLFDGVLAFARAAGTTSHTTGVLFGGTATFNSLNYVARACHGAGNALRAVSAIRGDSAAEVVVTAANTDATENVLVEVKGIMRVNAAGTLIPQFKFSAAPGGVPTIKANSHFRLQKIGLNTTGFVGAWT